MRSKSKLTFLELLRTMALCFAALLVTVFIASEVLRKDRDQEAAVRLEAGVSWRDGR